MSFHYIFVHGWGNGPDFWDKTASNFWESPKTSLDLGFIKTSLKSPLSSQPPSQDCKKIFITHSLGTLWALKHKPHDMSVLIAINGFYNFRPFSDEKIIITMKDRLARNPIPQMGAFWRECGIHPENPYLNLEKLQEGLNWLIHDNASRELRNLGIPVLSLTAKDDPILPVDLMRQHWSGYPLKIRETGGHSMPWTEPRWCAKQIKEFIDGLKLEK